MGYIISWTFGTCNLCIAYNLCLYIFYGKLVNVLHKLVVYIWKTSLYSNPVCKKHSLQGEVNTVGIGKEHIYSGGDDGILRIWNATDGKCSIALEGHQVSIDTMMSILSKKKKEKERICGKRVNLKCIEFSIYL